MARIRPLWKALPLFLIVLAIFSWGALGLTLPAKSPQSTATHPPAPADRPISSLQNTIEASATPPAAIATAAPTQAPAQPTSTQVPPPKAHFIAAIGGHHQYFSLGCEAATAKDWANYFGKDFNEFEFQYRLPVSDNPDLGFVGDVNAPWGQVPPYGYGVYAGPVADLLNQYGIAARATKGYTLEQIKAKIAQDKPVIAWVIGNVVGGVASEYTDSKGNKTIVAAYEHVVIVTGYSATHIRYMTNGKFFETPTGVFLNSWGVLGNMVIVDN